MYNNNYYQQPVRPQTGLKGRPVASFDEARAHPIDFDGSVFYFPDLANKRIYTKQINLDGTATLLMYELKELPVEAVNPSFVTREEFNDTINQLKALMAPPQPKKPIEEFKF